MGGVLASFGTDRIIRRVRVHDQVLWYYRVHDASSTEVITIYGILRLP